MDALADVVLLTHVAFVAFVVGGLLLICIGAGCHWAWVRLRWFRIAHLAAIGFVALEALIGMACPLTLLEDRLRQDTAQGGFIERWLHRVLYWDFPAWVFTLAYVSFALCVLATFVLIPPARRSDR
jgi:hypothetical protein